MFHAAGFEFHSDSYEWLVVAGDRAKYKGVDAVNGEIGYKFILTAKDDPESDLFRIKIWEEDEFGVETVVYDNCHEMADDGYDGTVIGGGNIVVHKAK